MQRFPFGRSGLCSTSELSEAPLGENEQQHCEPMSQGDTERTLFSSGASSVCGDIPASPNVKGSNENGSPGVSEKLTESSNALVSLSYVHEAVSVKTKQTLYEAEKNWNETYIKVFVLEGSNWLAKTEVLELEKLNCVCCFTQRFAYGLQICGFATTPCEQSNSDLFQS